MEVGWVRLMGHGASGNRIEGELGEGDRGGKMGSERIRNVVCIPWPHKINILTRNK